jgi:hypothetical protein
MKGGVLAGKASAVMLRGHGRFDTEASDRRRKRHPNYRLVKIHRAYSVDEIARVLGIHRNTARIWIKGGLRTIDDKRPILVLGQELVRFLQDRRARKKQPCPAGQMYCFRCRKPKVPASGMVEYEPRTATVGNLAGLCPDCCCMMHRIVGKTQVDAFFQKLSVAFPQALPRLNEMVQPRLNSDFRGDA